MLPGVGSEIKSRLENVVVIFFVILILIDAVGAGYSFGLAIARWERVWLIPGTVFTVAGGVGISGLLSTLPS